MLQILTCQSHASNKKKKVCETTQFETFFTRKNAKFSWWLSLCCQATAAMVFSLPSSWCRVFVYNKHDSVLDRWIKDDTLRRGIFFFLKTFSTISIKISKACKLQRRFKALLDVCKSLKLLTVFQLTDIIFKAYHHEHIEHATIEKLIKLWYFCGAGKILNLHIFQPTHNSYLNFEKIFETIEICFSENLQIFSF